METGPWRTRQIGPLVVRSRRKQRAEFVAFHEAVDDLGRELLKAPPGSWLVRLVWWLNGRLGGPSQPG